MQKPSQFCIPALKTPQPVMQYPSATETPNKGSICFKHYGFLDFDEKHLPLKNLVLYGVLNQPSILFLIDKWFQLFFSSDILWQFNHPVLLVALQVTLFSDFEDGTGGGEGNGDDSSPSCNLLQRKLILKRPLEFQVKVSKVVAHHKKLLTQHIDTNFLVRFDI